MIGIFDSGLGGLSALKEVRRLLPTEDIVYFGDTGRVPYGSRSKETIIKYSMQDMNFLMSMKVDAVMIACGTASSNAIYALRESYPHIPIVGVIDAGARAAAKASKNGIIGIAGTKSTIASRSYEKVLRALREDLTILPMACPLFVPLVENGFISPNDEITHLTAEHYLASFREAGADTVILGCTHYPIIADVIARVLPNASLINVSAAAAWELQEILTERKLLRNGNGTVRYFVSDEPHDFNHNASMFLGEEIDCGVTRIDIEKY